MHTRDFASQSPLLLSRISRSSVIGRRLRKESIRTPSAERVMRGEPLKVLARVWTATPPIVAKKHCIIVQVGSQGGLAISSYSHKGCQQMPKLMHQGSEVIEAYKLLPMFRILLDFLVEPSCCKVLGRSSSDQQFWCKYPEHNPFCPRKCRFLQ